METENENQGKQLDPVTIVFARDVRPDRVDGAALGSGGTSSSELIRLAETAPPEVASKDTPNAAAAASGSTTMRPSFRSRTASPSRKPHAMARSTSDSAIVHWAR